MNSPSMERTAVQAVAPVRILILNGFDRCGSSMIGGLLAKHPGIAYFYQPFSRTEVHRSQFEVWGDDHSAPATEAFLAELLGGKLDRDYISADLFDNHSSATEIDPSKLNVIKETKLHLKLPWLRARFPEIGVRGIWRDPRGIVCSLMRNDFYRSWYGDHAFEAAAAAAERHETLSKFASLVRPDMADAEKMAFIVAVRTDFMAHYLAPDEWVVYERVVEEPDSELSRLTRRFSLEEFAFSQHVRSNFNVSGLPFVRSTLWKSFFDSAQLKSIERIVSLIDRQPV